MSGMVGHIGNRDAVRILLDGLLRLGTDVDQPHDLAKSVTVE